VWQTVTFNTLMCPRNGLVREVSTLNSSLTLLIQNVPSVFVYDPFSKMCASDDSCSFCAACWWGGQKMMSELSSMDWKFCQWIKHTWGICIDEAMFELVFTLVNVLVISVPPCMCVFKFKAAIHVICVCVFVSQLLYMYCSFVSRRLFLKLSCHSVIVVFGT